MKKLNRVLRIWLWLNYRWQRREKQKQCLHGSYSFYAWIPEEHLIIQHCRQCALKSYREIEDADTFDSLRAAYLD